MKIYTEPRINRAELVREGDEVAMGSKGLLRDVDDYIDADVLGELHWHTVREVTSDKSRVWLYHAAGYAACPRSASVITRELVVIDPWSYVEPRADADITIGDAATLRPPSVP